jgi:hypothetical protein
MSRALIAGAVVVGGAVLAKRYVLSGGEFDMERFIERMPANSPPKWMFQNISAIRENTDRILEILEERGAEQGRAGVQPDAG